MATVECSSFLHKVPQTLPGIFGGYAETAEKKTLTCDLFRRRKQRTSHCSAFQPPIPGCKWYSRNQLSFFLRIYVESYHRVWFVLSRSRWIHHVLLKVDQPWRTNHVLFTEQPRISDDTLQSTVCFEPAIMCDSKRPKTRWDL